MDGINSTQCFCCCQSQTKFVSVQISGQCLLTFPPIPIGSFAYAFFELLSGFRCFLPKNAVSAANYFSISSKNCCAAKNIDISRVGHGHVRVCPHFRREKQGLDFERSNMYTYVQFFKSCTPNAYKTQAAKPRVQGWKKQTELQRLVIRGRRSEKRTWAIKIVAQSCVDLPVFP